VPTESEKVKLKTIGIRKRKRIKVRVLGRHHHRHKIRGGIRWTNMRISCPRRRLVVWGEDREGGEGTEENGWLAKSLNEAP